MGVLSVGGRHPTTGAGNRNSREFGGKFTTEKAMPKWHSAQSQAELIDKFPKIHEDILD